MNTVRTCLVLLLAACTPDGTYVLLTVDRAPGIPDGITNIDLSLTLAGKTADAKVQQVGLTFPTDLVLDVGNGAGELDIAATAATADGTMVATGATMATVTRGQRSAASLVLMSSAVSMLGIDRTSYDFGTVTTGATSGPVSFVVTNSGTDPTGAVSASVVGDAAAFDVSGCNGPALPPNASCTLSVTFKPSAAGSFHITVSVGANPGGGVSADITGMAVAPSPLIIAPSPKDYGPQLDGVSVSQTFTVTNSGTAATGALAAATSGTDAAQFVVGADNCTGQTLAAQATCTLQVTFTPSGPTGNRAASLTVSGMPGGTAATALAGRALTPASIAFAATTQDFGTVDKGTSATAMDFVVTNSGGQTSGALATQLTGDTGDFVVEMDTCMGQTLPSLGTCTIRAQFAPQGYGPKSVTVAVAGTPGGTASMTWTGTGHGTLTVTVAQPFGGDGNGDVSGASINCPTGACSASVDRSTPTAPMMTLTAVAHVDSDFTGWSGDCTGTGDCMLTVDGNKTVTPTFAIKRFALTVSKTNVAGASGTVTSVTAPAGATEISCGATCTASHPYGDMVTLTATPAAGFYFGGWSGDCTGFSPTCVLSMTAAHSAQATFTPANRIFTTSATYTIPGVQAQGTGTTTDVQMLSGADAICTSLGGSGSWKAFIASDTLNAGDRLPASARGWVRSDGNPFGDTLSSIFAGSVYYPPRLDENGTPIPLDGKFTYTGTATDGTHAGTCSNWSAYTGFGGSGIFGSPAGGAFSWLVSFALFACAASNHLVCMQTDYTAFVPPPVPPTGARVMFVTANNIPTNFSLASADAFCQSEASGHLSGNFVALLATDTTTPASRFTARGAAIVRPDGATIAAKDSDFFGGADMLTPPQVTPAGTYANTFGGFSGRAWVGSTAINQSGTTADTCYDTTSMTSWVGTGGSSGQTWDPTRLGLNSADACTAARPLICLQQ
jgi:hypothetical protein